MINPGRATQVRWVLTLLDMERGAAEWWRWLGSPVRDAIFALATAAVLVTGSYAEGNPTSPSDRLQFQGRPVPHPTAAVLVLVAVACVVLAWRRRWPVAVLAVSAAAVTGYTLLGYVNGAALVAPALALYAVATQVSVRRAVTAAALTMVVLMAASAGRNPFGHISGGGGLYLVPGLVAAALFGGIAAASRRAYLASVRDRAEQDARRQVDEERLRIARELHDAVAHTMATINVQAGSAVHVLPTRPEAAAEALQAIKTASKEGLRELRAILNVLRQADDADSTQPAPGLAQLDALAGSARRAGLATTLTVTTAPFPLPAAVELAAYRIVQESLTNVIRHAGPAAAEVSVRCQGDELRIEVADTGRGPPAGGSAGTGHGLAGMRERAAAVGGSIEAGPAPGGGFRVMARLPLPGRPASGAPGANGGGAAPAAGGGDATAAGGGDATAPGGDAAAATAGGGSGP